MVAMEDFFQLMLKINPGPDESIIELAIVHDKLCFALELGRFLIQKELLIIIIPLMV